MSDQRVRIGILGAARVTPHGIIRPAQLHPEASVTCVATRDATRARAFADTHDIPDFVLSYRELIEREDVDLVYVALPGAAHAHWSIEALNAGKAVLCEKPFALSSAEARAMVAAAHRAGRPLLEAFHYRFHPVILQTLDLVQSGAIGRLLNAEACFRAQCPWNPEEWRWLPSQGGGALMDAGCYAVHALRLIARKEPKVIAASTASQRGVDASTEAEFAFSDDFTARMSCSLIAEEPTCRLLVRGELGSIEVNPFVFPHVSSFTLERNGRVTQFSVDGQTSYQAQLAHVIEVIRGSAVPLTGGADSIANMLVMDAIRGLAPISDESQQRPHARQS
jgi:predicted dehydrogenase